MKQKIIDTNWEKLINDEIDVNNACSNFTDARQIIWLFSSSACFNIKSKNCQ
jgi:hypothetical protein